MRLPCLLTICFLIFNGATLLAQEDYEYYSTDTTKYYEIQLVDGSSFTGIIQRKDSSGITLLQESGVEIKIPFSRIKKMELLPESPQHPYSQSLSNPNPYHYLMSKSAIPLEKGQFYYRNTYVLINSFGVGITKNFSLEAGFEAITTLIVLDPIFYLSPGFNFQMNDRLHAGVNVFYGSIPDFGSGDGGSRIGLGTVSGNMTYGNRETNVTFGLAYPIFEESVSDIPVLKISAMIHLSNTFSFISDNWLVTEEESSLLFSYGIRFKESNVSGDVIFINGASSDGTSGIGIGLPYFSGTFFF